jgi:large subunit ribosomal protein L10e
MRGAYGKPNGSVARVNIGQILLSVRTRDSSKWTLGAQIKMDMELINDIRPRYRH